MKNKASILKPQFKKKKADCGLNLACEASSACSRLLLAKRGPRNISLTSELKLFGNADSPAPPTATESELTLSKIPRSSMRKTSLRHNGTASW